MGFAQDSNTGNQTYTLNIPAVALLSIQGGSSVTLAPVAPNEAGMGLNFSGSVSNKLWLNVSSTVSRYVNTVRDVSVQITSGTLPAAFQISVVAASAVGGTGTLGTPTAAKVLSNSPQSIITGFGSCYTGNGIGTGYRLTYTLTALSYGTIKFDQNTNLIITYTLSE